MLRITPSTSGSGAKKYFGEGLQRPDYYLDGQEVVGLWGGKGADRLGLSGEVDQARYFALCDNRHPQGGRLTSRDRDGRRVGYDFTFSAPKSVSLLYELSGDERILSAFRESAQETMREVESEMKTRVRAKGADTDRVTGNMVWAEFVHFTSRPVNGIPDPHLHAHVYAFNATFDEKEKRWKAGQFGDIKRDAPYWQAAFDARLAKHLNVMGYVTEKDSKYSFEVAGVPESAIDQSSQRRNTVERIAASKGITDPVAKHEITRRGREQKVTGMTRDELRVRWQDRLTPENRSALRSVMRRKAAPTVLISPQQSLDYAVGHSFTRHSTISDKRLKAEALTFGVGSVLPEEIEHAARQRRDLIRVEKRGQLMATTKGVLGDEVAMLKFARDDRGAFAPLGEAANRLQGLSIEQQAAASHVLGSRDRVVGIRGGAGTGKTTVIKTIVDGIEQKGKSGRKVYGFAPSSSASRGTLRQEGIENAETLATLLRSDKLQADVRGQVLLVDEAGMVSTRDMARLMEIAKRRDCRVVLVGDYRQHASVDAGDAFRLLESEGGVRYAELKDIRRQRTAGYRSAVAEISKGTSQGLRHGFDLLDKAGAILEAHGEERHDLLVRDYVDAVFRNKTALVIAPTHAEGERLTEAIRAKLKETGALGTRERMFSVRKSTGWTESQKSDCRNYRPGMVVEFQQATPGARTSIGGRRQTRGGFAKGEAAVVTRHDDGRVILTRQDGSQAPLPDEHVERFQVYATREATVASGERIRLLKNDRKLRISNGDIRTVSDFTKDGELRLADGTVLPKSYAHWGPGYVDTSYASQGKTVDRVFIAAGDASLPAVGAQQWYVSVSRGRDSAKVYVENKAEMREAIARGGPRLSAVELLKPDILAPKESRVKTMLERSRVARFFHERVRSWHHRVRQPITGQEIGHA